MVAAEKLQVVDPAVVGAIGGVAAHHLRFLPGGLKVVFVHGAAVALRAEHGRIAEAVARVRRADAEHVAELVERHLLLDRVGELAADLGAGEGPLHLHVAETAHQLLVGVDQLGLLIPEIEAVAQAKAGHAALAVEGRDGDLPAEGQLGQHDRQVMIVGPVENPGAVREGQRVGGERAAGAHQWQLHVQAALGVAVEEQTLLLAVGFVENDEAPAGAGGFEARLAFGHLHGIGEARPLAKVARAVEVGHARGVRAVGRAFLVADGEEAMLLVEVGLVEEIKEPAENVEIARLQVVRDPAVPQALQQDADAMHLAVGARSAAVGPAEAVGAHEVGQHPDVLLGVGAQGGELALAHAGIRMELQRRADEHEAHHAVEIEIAAEPLGRVVEETGRTGLVDAVHHPLDQAAGFILLGEAEAEAADSLGDVEGLPVVVVVAAMQQHLVESLPGFVDQPLPHGVALLGRAEAQQAEGGVGEAVLRRRIGENLGGHAARREVDDVVPLQRGLAGGAVKFSECKGDVPGFVRAGLLAGNRGDGAVGVDRVQILAQHGPGHVETLLGETVHAGWVGVAGGNSEAHHCAKGSG